MRVVCMLFPWSQSSNIHKFKLFRLKITLFNDTWATIKLYIIKSFTQAKECLESGEDIPGDILGALLKERISKKDCSEHVNIGEFNKNICQLLYKLIIYWFKKNKKHFGSYSYMFL